MSMHIGQNIKQILEERGISKAEMGRRLNMSSTNVHKIFLRDTIDTALLLRISHILRYNFFYQYSRQLAEFPDPEQNENESNELLLLRELLHTKDELIRALQAGK